MCFIRLFRSCARTFPLSFKGSHISGAWYCLLLCYILSALQPHLSRPPTLPSRIVSAILSSRYEHIAAFTCRIALIGLLSSFESYLFVWYKRNVATQQVPRLHRRFWLCSRRYWRPCMPSWTLRFARVISQHRQYMITNKENLHNANNKAEFVCNSRIDCYSPLASQLFVQVARCLPRRLWSWSLVTR